MHELGRGAIAGVRGAVLVELAVAVAAVAIAGRRSAVLVELGELAIAGRGAAGDAPPCRAVASSARGTGLEQLSPAIHTERADDPPGPRAVATSRNSSNAIQSQNWGYIYWHL